MRAPRAPSLSRRILLSTTMLVGALTAYRGRAYAACDPTGGSSYLCTGVNTTTQTINADNATVTTGPGFTVVAPAVNGIVVTGDGALSYTDNFATTLDVGVGRALDIHALGDVPAGNPGSITVVTNGTIAAGVVGIQVVNDGSGATSVTTTGSVTGVIYGGIVAVTSGTDLSVTTGPGTVFGGAAGVIAYNYGSGTTTVTTHGDVTGTILAGINAVGNGDVIVTTGAGTTTRGGEVGIAALSTAGSVTVTANGDAIGDTDYGIVAMTYAAGSTISITTGAGTSVSGGSFGIEARNLGGGGVTIVTGGDVAGGGCPCGGGIYAFNYTSSAATGISVTTASGTTISGSGYGILTRNLAAGATTIIANGDIGDATTSDAGIYAWNAGTSLSITTGAGSTVTSDRDGIVAVSIGSGSISITTGGAVTGISRNGIDAELSSGGTTSVTVGSASTVTSQSTSLDHFGIKLEGGRGNVIIAGSVAGAGGGAVGFDQFAAENDRFEIDPGASVTGNVLAAAGTDTFVLGGTGNGTFDLDKIGDTQQYRGFELFRKEGASTWAVTGSSAEDWTIARGTLQLGNGATSGSITGSIVDNGDLAVNRSDTYVMANLISGSGTFHQIGSGTTILTNDNTFTGKTTVSAGTLQLGDGGTAGSVGGNVEADATFAINRSDTYVFTRLISGDGAFRQIGPGTTILTADNTFSGTTTVAAGILQLGNGGTTGSIASDFVVDTSLVVDRAGTATLPGAISGPGTFSQTGPGTTVLTGDSTFTGGTTISAGTLQLGNGGASGSLVGDIVDNGTLAIDRAGVLTLDGVISGTGAFNQIGPGTTILTADNTFTGPTTASAGKLVVNGTVVSPVTIESGGMLGGTGLIDNSLTVLAGGIYAPGQSIGTQTVSGNFTLSHGATYQVEVDDAGQSDLLVVKGTIDLTGATLRVLELDGEYDRKTKYLIIDNDGSDAVIGKFSEISSALAFLTPTVSYTGGDGNDVVLTLSRTPFVDVAETPNEKAVAKALDSSPFDSVLVQSVIGLDKASALAAFNALSGEVHASLEGILVDASRYVRDAVLGRLMQATYAKGNAAAAALAAGGPDVAAAAPQGMMGLGAGDGGTPMIPAGADGVFWTRAFGAWATLDGDGNAATADRSLGGFLSGFDARVSDTWRFGFATGFSETSASVDARRSSGDADSAHLAAYAGGFAGPVAVRLGAAWAWNDIETSRAIVYPGFSERAKASYDGDTGQIFGEVAYPTGAAGMALEPFAGLAFVKVSSESFTEKGGFAALTAASNDESVGYSTLGLRAATTLHSGGMTVVPRASAAWQHAFDGTTPDFVLAFATTGTGFEIYGVPLAENSALIELGLDASLGPDAVLGLSYSAQLADDIQDHAVKGRLAWRF